MTQRANAPKDAPWLARYVEEMLSFPESTCSVQVDSTSQALAYQPNVYTREFLDGLAELTFDLAISRGVRPR